MNKLIYLVIFSFFSTGIYAQMKDLVQYVNTLQGTDSHFGLSYGNTYPTTGMPYAMHTWSAQTGKNGEGWKYQYAVDNIRGFCQSHQCSPWMSDYAVYSFMPMVGKLGVNQEMRATKFSHDNEIAKPHYYKVMLDNGITTEMAPTTRGVHLRFSYPSTEDAYLVIDGYTDMSEIKIDPVKRQISGWVNNQRFVNNSKTFRSYFVVQFDKAFEDYGMWENQKDEIFPKKLEGEGKGYGAYIKFKKGSKVQAKAASSYISAEQAVITLNDELGKDKNLEATKIRGHKTWNELLNRIQVEGGTDEQMKTFYSCLFRANLFSRKFYERKANGEPYYYSPYDGKVYDGYMYTDNGFWDTFRSQFPLTNILHPTMQGRYMNALLAAQEQCGWLPSWSAPGETGGMLGNHSISLLADAWAKGIRTFDPEKALKAYAHEAMNKGPWGGANGRGFWKEYFELGYVPYPESMGSSAQTMEYAYDDWCISVLADSLGDVETRDKYARFAGAYKSYFDPETRFMRGRDSKGKWRTPFNPRSSTHRSDDYCEGTAWQWTWFVPHDVPGLVGLMGGEEAFAGKLDSLFTVSSELEGETVSADISGLIGQYAHGNEPSHHIIHLYNYVNRPWRTQELVDSVLHSQYRNAPDGLSGNEDCGQMSAWYILNAMGFYQVCPGEPVYSIGRPLFEEVTIHLPGQKDFVIRTKNNSKENKYVQSILLNGKPLEQPFFTHSDLTAGGVMEISMGAEPFKP